MAVFRGVIRSDALAMDTGLTVILPYDRPAEHQQNPCKVLYLLHGLGDNCEAWTRYTSVERYARELGLAVIMPEVQRSFYQNMQLGAAYLDYIARELPEIAGKLFHISTKAADSYIAGLSMGGYGAMYCALTYPERYAAAASFSGVLDIADALESRVDDYNAREFTAVFGEGLRVPDNANLLTLIPQRAGGSYPDLFVTCGRQDFLYEGNLNFMREAEKHKLRVAYHEWDGVHEWGFWDRSLQMWLNHISAL